MKKFGQIVFLIAVVALGYIYRDWLRNLYEQAVNQYFPCKLPITYSIGEFDTQFGISQADFLRDLAEAEAIWEKPIGKNLFQYEPNGSMKVNLIYDSRQQTTNQLKTMGIIVENNKASYDALKAKYDSLNQQYLAQKTDFENKLAAYQSDRQAYEAEVSAVNSRGGADRATAQRLNAERDSLNQEASALTQMQNDLNTSAANINAVAQALNDLAATLNVGINQYNNIGDKFGGEFDEGLYKSSASGREIDIYQFDNHTKLVRVLAHELGHALGLGHVTDPTAIMYYLNDGTNEKLSATDLSALKNLCGIK